MSCDVFPLNLSLIFQSKCILKDEFVICAKNKKIEKDESTRILTVHCQRPVSRQTQICLKSQSPYTVVRGGGGPLPTNFQLLMLSPNLLKFQSPYTVVWGGGGSTSNQLPTFDAESKYAKIPKSLYGGGGGESTNKQL